MAAIQRIARQALLTFRSRDAAAFPGNLEKLKGMMDKITAADINLPTPDTGADKVEESKVFGAPVTHMSIYECPHFTLGVFILNKHGVTIPLHDHPEMHGICKVLFGSVRIRSYDRISSKDFPCELVAPEFKDSYGKIHLPKLIAQRLELPGHLVHIMNTLPFIDKLPLFVHFGLGFQVGTANAQTETSIMTKFNSDKILTAESDVCELTHTEGNFHSVQANGGQAAFLDILAPPYAENEGRDCTYFRELTVTTKAMNDAGDDGRTRWLVQVPQPRDFFCDSMMYLGPPVAPEE